MSRIFLPDKVQDLVISFTDKYFRELEELNQKNQLLHWYMFGNQQEENVIDEIVALAEVIKKKYYLNINKKKMGKILKFYFSESRYSKFVQKFKGVKKKPPEFYADIYLNLYGEDIEGNLDSLLRLMKEKFYGWGRSKLLKVLEKRKKEEKLNRFEERLNAEKDSVISDPEKLTGYEFEKFLKRLFELMGYKVELTKQSQDQGADLIIEKFGERTAVQAKRHKSKVGNRAVQEVAASMKYYNAHKGMVVITGQFTKQAVTLAASNGIKLIFGNELKELIGRYFRTE